MEIAIHSLGMEADMDLSGKAALVTGAGRGLGAEVAKELARRGAQVVLVARAEHELAAVVASIRRGGGTAHALVFDVSDKASVIPLVQATTDLVGPVDVLVQCASMLGPVRRGAGVSPMPLLFDTDCEDFAAVLETNLVGPFRIAKALGVNMLVRGGGTQVFVSSDAAVSAYPTWGSYGVSKAAQDHLVRVLAAELGDSAVRAFSVDPGEMDTRMHADALPEADPSTLLAPRDVARVVVDAIVDPSETPSGSRFCAADRIVSPYAADVSGEARS